MNNRLRETAAHLTPCRNVIGPYNMSIDRDDSGLLVVYVQSGAVQFKGMHRANNLVVVDFSKGIAASFTMARHGAAPL